MNRDDPRVGTNLPVGDGPAPWRTRGAGGPAWRLGVALHGAAGARDADGPASRAGRRAAPFRFSGPRGSLRGALLAACSLTAAAAPGRPASAQVALYGDRPPDGFAYVRFVNTTADPVTVRPSGFGEPVALGVEGPDRVSPYRVVEGVAGRKLDVAAGSAGRDGQGALRVEPGSFDTVMVGPGLTFTVVADQAETSQTRARLAFYNAAPGCAAAGLQLDPGGRSVFAGVAPGSMRGRSVNPATDVRLRATCPTMDIAPLRAGEVGAGGQYSIWVMAPAGKAISFLSTNAIAPYLR